VGAFWSRRPVAAVSSGRGGLGSAAGVKVIVICRPSVCGGGARICCNVNVSGAFALFARGEAAAASSLLMSSSLVLHALVCAQHDCKDCKTSETRESGRERGQDWRRPACANNSPSAASEVRRTLPARYCSWPAASATDVSESIVSSLVVVRW
jgi:hypothetical protein